MAFPSRKAGNAENGPRALFGHPKTIWPIAFQIWRAAAHNATLNPVRVLAIIALNPSLRQWRAFHALKVPPGGLSWLSALWVVLGAFVAYSSFAAGDNFLGVGGLLFCAAGVLIWLDVREIALPLMIWFSLVIVSAVLLLAFKGMALRPLTGILMAGYSIYELNQRRHEE